MSYLCSNAKQAYIYMGLRNKLKCHGTFLKYHWLITCLKKYSEKCDRDNVSKCEYSYISGNIEKNVKNKKGTRDMYAILSNNHVHLDSSPTLWRDMRGVA